MQKFLMKIFFLALGLKLVRESFYNVDPIFWKYYLGMVLIAIASELSKVYSHFLDEVSDKIVDKLKAK